jgi:hypothetical protein
VVFVLVNKEGDVGPVSRYTEMGASDTTKAEVGFNVAAAKRSSGLFNFGVGVDSTEMFPCCERTMRIYDMMSLRIKQRSVLPQHLVWLTEILVFQRRIASTLEPIKRELRGRGPRMNIGSRGQPVDCVREEKVR